MSVPDVTQPNLIIPAPEELRREVGVTWYEVELSESQRTARLVAFANRQRQLGVFEAQLQADAGVTTVISDGQRRVTIAVRRGAITDGKYGVAGDIDGREFSVRRGATPERVELEPGERDVLRPWRGLGPSLEALSQATAKADEEGLGCSVCLLVGATVVQAAELCVGGDAGACGALIDTYDLFQDGCDPPPCH